MAQQKPTITSTAARVKSGEILYINGSGFTPQRAVVSHMTRPDKSEYNPLRLRASAAGDIVHKIDTVMLDLGTFEIWMEDDASNAASNRIRFSVEPNPH